MNRVINYYTDGAFSYKTEMGGWAFVCVENDNVIDEVSGYEPYSTNNRMELTALLGVLEQINDYIPGTFEFNIYTDSAYIERAFNEGWFKNWMRNGWRTADKQEVKNQDLWKRIVALYIKLTNKYPLHIVKVEAHKDNKWNNYADLLAVKARKKLEK